ncbi:MAG: DivIVA domain-containing protein [Nitrospinales bacterium]
MRFTYLDILEQCFHEKFRGYSKEEVDTFLQLVSNDFQEMAEEIKNFKLEIEKKDRLIESLEKAQKEKSVGAPSPADISPVVKDQVRRIILLAREKAETHTKKKQEELRHLQEEIKRLKSARKTLVENIKVNAKNYLESLQKKNHTASSGNASSDKKM